MMGLMRQTPCTPLWAQCTCSFEPRPLVSAPLWPPSPAAAALRPPGSPGQWDAGRRAGPVRVWPGGVWPDDVGKKEDKKAGREGQQGGWKKAGPQSEPSALGQGRPEPQDTRQSLHPSKLTAVDLSNCTLGARGTDHFQCHPPVRRGTLPCQRGSSIYGAQRVGRCHCVALQQARPEQKLIPTRNSGLAMTHGVGRGLCSAAQSCSGPGGAQCPLIMKCHPHR